MTGDLRRVLVRRPLPADADAWEAYAWRARPDVAAAQAEHEAFCLLLEEAGAEVVVSEHDPGNPDAIYTYDPTLVGRDGAVLLQPGKEGRRREPEATAGPLEAAGVPIAARVDLPATVEGGDTVWLDEQTLLVGIGYRTNAVSPLALHDALPGVDLVLLRPPALERRRRGDAPDELHLAARRRPRARLSPDRPDAADVAPRRARHRRRRGARRGVRHDGGERPRARAAPRARARGERRDAAADGARRRGCRHVSRRRDLAQGRRRADLPDATVAARAEAQSSSKVSWRTAVSPETPTPTRRSAPGRSRRPRSRRAQARSPIRSASSIGVGSVVERERIEKSE